MSETARGQAGEEPWRTPCAALKARSQGTGMAIFPPTCLLSRLRPSVRKNSSECQERLARKQEAQQDVSSKDRLARGGRGGEGGARSGKGRCLNF